MREGCRAAKGDTGSEMEPLNFAVSYNVLLPTSGLHSPHQMGLYLQAGTLPHFSVKEAETKVTHRARTRAESS